MLHSLIDLMYWFVRIADHIFAPPPLMHSLFFFYVFLICFYSPAIETIISFIDFYSFFQRISLFRRWCVHRIIAFTKTYRLGSLNNSKNKIIREKQFTTSNDERSCIQTLRHYAIQVQISQCTSNTNICTFCTSFF